MASCIPAPTVASCSFNIPSNRWWTGVSAFISMRMDQRTVLDEQNNMCHRAEWSRWYNQQAPGYQCIMDFFARAEKVLDNTPRQESTSWALNCPFTRLTNGIYLLINHQWKNFWLQDLEQQNTTVRRQMKSRHHMDINFLNTLMVIKHN